MKMALTHKLLQQHVIRILDSDSSLSKEQSSALRRLISKDSLDLKMALFKVGYDANQEQLDRYLREVINFYLEIEFFQPCREKDYKDWLRKTSKGAELLAGVLVVPPSVDLQIPPPLVNVAALMQVGLENITGEMGRSLYAEEISPMLKHIFQQMPVTVLLDAIVQVAAQKLESPPNYYWEQEYGIKAPRKHGYDEFMFREQLLLKGISRITRKLLDEPNQELVATLVNTLLNVEKFSAESVRKLP